MNTKLPWIALFCVAFVASFFAALRPASATIAGVGQVSGRVFHTGGTVPAAGIRVELRKGPFDTLVATRYTTSNGSFSFANVPTITNQSFRVKAGTGSSVANWYFVLNPGQSRYQNLSLPFWYTW